MERFFKPAWQGFACVLMILISASALAAPVTAELDRNRIIEGETVTLVFQTDDPQQSLETSLDVLEESFQVIDHRSETQMSIVNGRQAAIVRQIITLEPRKAGDLLIPSFRFRGGSVTAALSLKVDPAPELAPGELAPVFIEVELDPLEGPYYVHAQLSLKVRIFYQQNLTEAAINPPEPEQASVRLLDELPYHADRNGTRYRVLERRYAIFPERSGELVIPAMQLTGRLIERPADRLWQPSVRGRRVRIESDPLSLDISPRPPEFTGEHWLPARKITLSQQITDADSLRVGEPVTRTIMLDAVGLEEHMLEEPSWPEIADARIYPDQPQGISRDDGEWVLGHREYRYAVVPEAPGVLVLPELRLHWWDTVASEERVAVLPEHRIEVLPSTIAPVNTTTPGVATSGFNDGFTTGVDQVQLNRWRVVAIIFALLWLATLYMYLRGGRGPKQSPQAAVSSGETQDELLSGLQRACKKGNAGNAREMLGLWVRKFGPAEAHGSLMKFAGMVDDPELADTIRTLDAGRFSASGMDDWDGRALWTALDAWMKSANFNPGSGNNVEFGLYSQTG